jgi:hypothetical protein
VREAAAWAARALRTADGTMRHPALFVDTNATVTMAPWYDEPVHMQCSAGETTSWRLFSSISVKPWINPISWRLGIRAQMAAGKLLSTPPNEGDVLNFNHHGVSFVWRDGQWHDVWIKEEKFTLRAHGTVTFPDRGAIAVAKRFSAQDRPDELEKAGFLAEAMWLRAQDAPWPSLRRMLDHRLGQTTKDALTDRAEVISPSVRDLVEHPKQYHGRRIHTRGIFRSMFENMTFADAWFDCATRFPLGSWLVEVDGTWSCDGSEYGHFGFYKSHLAGDARLISIQDPRPIAPDRIRFSRPYVPLVSEIAIERRLQGFTHNKEWLHRLGGDARIPEPETPDSRRARIVFTYTAFHMICLFSWTWLDEPKPLVPEAATAANPGNRGQFVELKGTLTPNGTNWPLLDGLLRVVPPPMSRTADRYPMPQPNVQEALRQWLGDGKVVRILGEVGLEKKIIYAISVNGHTRPFA